MVKIPLNRPITLESLADDVQGEPQEMLESIQHVLKLVNSVRGQVC